ncbi:DUF645 family protein [Vibrio cholerae]|uniref:DUF645 family protein n=4 Tax=Vibrio cholerae TaxID=666 RepID=UPI00069F3E18|nr:DUF645 family protein [Vibrio cholerae]
MLDVPHGKFGFTKGCIIAVILLSLSRTLNRGQLNLERFEFWQPTSQLLALDVCLSLVLCVVSPLGGRYAVI